MIYILKFIAAFLLPPGLFVLLGIILSAYLWRQRQNFGRLPFGLSACLTLLLYFCSTLLGAKLLGQPLENRYSQQPADAQVIVVLGGGSVGSAPDGTERGGLMSAGAARLLTAARLAKQHSLPVLISGGQVFSDGVSEALVAERILLQLGLPQEQIIVETQARTTKENAAYTAALCRERGYNNVLLLTSALHMPRSMQFFEHYLGGQGIKVAAYPCDYTLNPQGKFNPRWLVPQLQAFDVTCMALHEYVGMAGAFLQH
ncbi:YdcF family protein [uncultured Phascolarctobacterium sp.]|uniref:YdcF family protein n=1 Tax=uncultured Phascolarctobacterium sp. TaxID=512296 RepID=UPI0025FD07FF|nr:YdcF family protein [uncultured Phascolarctobacterium sp.]